MCAVFCPNCGAKNEETSIFCSVCGKEMPRLSHALDSDSFDNNQNNQSRYNTPRHYEKLSLALTAFLSIVFPGLGILYVGKTVEGFMMMGLNILCFLTGFLFPPLWIICAMIWITSLVYSIVKAGEYNSELDRTGQPPW